MQSLSIHPTIYMEKYQGWRNAPDQFWLRETARIDWVNAPLIAKERKSKFEYSWFPDGTVNPCYNALDRHVERGSGERIAIHWQSPMLKQERSITYNQLHDLTARIAGGLERAGVNAGDRVMIYMPMIPESIAAMIAPTRIGAIHVVVFGGFAATELARRIDDCAPKVIITAAGAMEAKGFIPYVPIVDEAVSIASSPPETIVVLQRDDLPLASLKAHHTDFEDFISGPHSRVVASKATDPLYILYTSGTTGSPKGVVHDIGGFLTAVHWCSTEIYGMRKGKVFWAASDIGWAAAHTCSVWGPLLVGATTVLLEGKPVSMPDAGTYWRLIERYKVEALFAAPTPFRAMRREDPEGTLANACDLSSLRRFYIAGEYVDPSTYEWIASLVPAKVINHWWQTETAWPIACSMLESNGQMPFNSEVGLPMPGYDLQVLNENSEPVANDQTGTLAIKLPMPPGFMTGLWRNEDHFHSTYFYEFPGYYTTSDAGTRGGNGLFSVTGRTDDVINVSGHRLSTGDLEASLTKHPKVKECVIVAKSDPISGYIPIAFVIADDLLEQESNLLMKNLNAMVRRDIGPVARLGGIIFANQFPTTRSGKVLRNVVRSLLNGHAPKVPPTIENPEAVADLRQCIISQASIYQENLK